jgi:fermentation-respiration switch protein FrsA (DUF1100 family)
MRRSRVAALVTVTVVAMLLLLLIMNGDRLFYFPGGRVYATPAGFGLVGPEEVPLSAPGGPALHAFWFAAEKNGGGPARGTVVYCHGNSHNMTHHLRFVAWLPKRGFNLLAFDYRGFGKSVGSAGITREGTVADTLAAIDFSLARDPARTVVFGHSLGGAVAIVATARRPAVRALAVECTFPSYRKVARAALPLLGPLVSLGVSKGFDPEDALAGLPPRPLLVIHGTDDRMVPFRLGRELFDAASEPHRFHEERGGDHFSPWVREGATFETMLTEFFDEAIGKAVSGAGSAPGPGTGER